LEGTGRRLKPNIRILCGDSDGGGVTLGTGFSLKLVGFGFDHIETDFRIAVGGNSVELIKVLDTVERKTRRCSHRDR